MHPPIALFPYSSTEGSGNGKIAKSEYLFPTLQLFHTASWNPSELLVSFARQALLLSLW